MAKVNRSAGDRTVSGSAAQTGKKTLTLASAGGESRAITAHRAKFKEALALLHDFEDAVSTLTSKLVYDADFPKITALMVGLEPILKRAALSSDPDYVESCADQIGALLYTLDEEIPAAAREAPLFQDVSLGIDKLRDLISEYRSPAPHPIASPGPDTNASPDWRDEVGKLVKRAQDVLNDDAETLEALTGETYNGGFAFHLIYDARNLLDTDISDSADYYGDVILPALAMILGARDMKDTHRALSAMLEPVVSALKEAEEIAPSCPAEVSGYQAPAAAPIARPAASSKAGEAPTEAARLSKDASDALHLVWHLADALCDEAVPVDEDWGRVAGMALGIKRAIEGVEAQLEQLYFETMAAAEDGEK